MDDGTLLERCRQGDPAAWAALWAGHAGRLKRALAERLGSEAEEISQRVFVKLAEGRLAGFRGECSLGTWLMAVALREAAELRRTEARRKPLPPEPREVPQPLLELCRAEDAQRVREALGKLPARDRLLLSLLFWDAATHADAARHLRVSSHSITTLLHRAGDRLKKILGETP